jgi:CheY-specific phosphatase CheX
MEKESLISAMKTSISEVLETMFFLPIDFLESPDLDSMRGSMGHEMAVAKLEFNGPLNGHFIFIIPKELAASTTASFLGKDEHDVNDDHIHETVKEIANMVAGNTFSHYDDQAVYNLGIPELLQTSELKGGHQDKEEQIFICCNTLDSSLAFQMVFWH